MTFIFDYIFFRITSFYLQISDDKSNYIIGSVILTIFQIFNTITFLLLLSIYYRPLTAFFDNSNMQHGKFVFMILCTVILALNIYKYSKVVNYEQLKQRWANENTNLKKKRNLMVCAYLSFSIVFLVISIWVYK